MVKKPTLELEQFKLLFSIHLVEWKSSTEEALEYKTNAESFRDQQDEDDCKTLQEAGLASSLAKNSASKSQVDFHAPASTKKPR